jgi:NADH-quinone oxidoreductase subunit A
MLAEYLPIFVFIIIGIVVGFAMWGACAGLSKHKPYAAKNAPYECGFPEFHGARIPVNVKFYLIAILFILFDLETAFFFPWAVVLRKIGYFGFCSMMLFLAILVIGFIYEWKRGALEWE